MNELKKHLRAYLTRMSVKHDYKKKTYACPFHSDANPSATLYENPNGVDQLYCPVCEKSWSIIDVAGQLSGHTEYKDRVKHICDVLNITEPEHTPKPKPTPADTVKPVSLPIEDARKIYTPDAIQKPGKKITGTWKYCTPSGNVIALDVRFEADGKKEIITYWNNGRLTWTKTPVFFYNLDEALKTDKPLLIVEGAKCAELARVLPEFTPLSWSGGAGKAGKIDWSIFADHEIYIYPDDDGPGQKAAETIRATLPQAKIIPPLPEARKIKPFGADIEEVLKCLTPEELTEYILKNGTAGEPPSIPQDATMSDIEGLPALSPDSDGGSPSLPFKILGINRNNRANFIDFWGHHVESSANTLTKQKIMDIAPLSVWESLFPGHRGGVDWDKAADFLIDASKRQSFSDCNLRGRGAWRDRSGVCYFDGLKVYGNHEPRYYFPVTERMAGVGLDSQPAPPELLADIRESVFKMSFSTHADAVRALSWGVLAHFAGALPLRPALLITGESSSGKSTLANSVLRPLSMSLWLNGAESTVPGIRGLVKRDSRAIMCDEFEADTEKKAHNRADLFSLMRVNVTEDTPDTIKGTKDGGYQSFKMNSMFAFIAINPEVGSIADENRIFRIHMDVKKTGNGWKDLERRIKELLSEENCARVRSYVWQKFETIEKNIEPILKAVQKKINRDYRSCMADALLISAFITVWRHTDEPTEEQINNLLEKFYSYQPARENRNEAAEAVDRILDEIIEIIHDHAREKITLRECLSRVHDPFIEEDLDGGGNPVRVPIEGKRITAYKQTAARYGVKIYDGNLLAIKNDYYAIKKILSTGQEGYSGILKRHPGFVEGSKVISFAGGEQKRSTIIQGIFGDPEELHLNFSEDDLHAMKTTGYKN